MVDIKRAKWVRKEDRGYTIEPKSILAREGLICDSCGIQSQCPIYQFKQKAESHADISVKTCTRYVPVLGFRKPYLGLNGYFNTLRAGDTWMRRVDVGKTIALCDAKSGAIIGFGTVKQLDCAPFDDALRDHAHLNHMAVAGKTTDDVEHVLRKSYGHFLKDDAKLTAIYIERITDNARIRQIMNS